MKNAYPIENKILLLFKMLAKSKIFHKTHASNLSFSQRRNPKEFNMINHGWQPMDEDVCEKEL